MDDCHARDGPRCRGHRHHVGLVPASSGPRRERDRAAGAGRDRNLVCQRRPDLGVPCGAVGQPGGAVQGAALAFSRRCPAPVPAAARSGAVALVSQLPDGMLAVPHARQHRQDRRARALFAPVLGETRKELDLHYDDLQRGILHFYTSQDEYDAAIKPAALMRKLGCELELVDRERMLAIEPALRFTNTPIVGGSMTYADESRRRLRVHPQARRQGGGARRRFKFGTHGGGDRHRAQPGNGRRGAHPRRRATGSSPPTPTWSRLEATAQAG